jgi:hypothetical protein
MTYDEIDPGIRGCLAAHEVFRRFGFKAGDIFVALQGGIAISVLRHDGKEFTVGVGKFGGSQDEFANAWAEASQAVNAGSVPKEDAARIYEEGIMYGRFVEVMMAMANKGIDVQVPTAGEKMMAELN